MSFIIYDLGLVNVMGVGVQEELREDDCDQVVDFDKESRKYIFKIGFLGDIF